MPQELYARLMLAFIGFAFGVIPMIYAFIRKQFVWGIISLAACGILSTVGFPYFVLPLAGILVYLIYRTTKKSEERQTQKNRENYKKKMKQEFENSDVRTSGYIENKKVAGSAWPPVDQMMDEDAAKEFFALTAQDEERRAQNENK